MATSVQPLRALVDAPVPPRAGEEWQGFVAIISELAAQKAGWPAELEKRATVVRAAS
jgi:DNA helicase-2/ATP-dependent DNA helicase PcrA